MTFIYLRKREKNHHLLEKLQNGSAEMYKPAHWQVLLTQSKWFQETASFLKGQKVSGRPQLLNIFYHVTSIKTVLATSFVNLKTSTV